MGKSHSLRPVVVDTSLKPGAAQRGKWHAKLGAAAWVCLLSMGAALPLSHAESRTEPTRCGLSQQTPLYVGFPQDRGVDSFEETALASVAIVREVKRWACEGVGGGSEAQPALQQALASNSGLRIREVQFTGSDLKQAQVVLQRDVAREPRSAWVVNLSLAEEGNWNVTGSRSRQRPSVAAK